jgi:hypothetical protein
MAKVQTGTEKGVVIRRPNMQEATFLIRGSTPLVMNKFSEKAKNKMRDSQEHGKTPKTGKARDPKDFQKCYEDAKHVSSQGWVGIPASAFRCALISACRLVDFKMTLARLSAFIVADGFDVEDGTPLVKITKGKPEMVVHHVRNESGVCDVRPRPMWKEGWEARVHAKWDGDQFSLTDISNLLMRVGMQVGILEGRPDSKKSAGMGWGLFDLIGGEQ